MKNNTRSLSRGVKSIISSRASRYPSVYLDSNGELSVYKCYSLIEYTDSMAKIKASCGIVGIYGHNLVLNTFSNSEITVSGNIEKIEFEEYRACEE